MLEVVFFGLVGVALWGIADRLIPIANGPRVRIVAASGIGLLLLGTASVGYAITRAIGLA